MQQSCHGYRQPQTCREKGWNLKKKEEKEGLNNDNNDQVGLRVRGRDRLIKLLTEEE